MLERSLTDRGMEQVVWPAIPRYKTTQSCDSLENDRGDAKTGKLEGCADHRLLDMKLKISADVRGIRMPKQA